MKIDLSDGPLGYYFWMSKLQKRKEGTCLSTHLYTGLLLNQGFRQPREW
jgi:hypothetical protein